MNSQSSQRNRERRKTSLEYVSREVLNTREAREVLITLLPQFFKVWAGKNRVKGAVSSMVGSMVCGQLSKPDDVFEADEIQALFKDTDFVRKLAALLPGFIGTIVDLVSDAGATLEHLSPDTQKDILQMLLARNRGARAGELLTSLARILSSIHELDATFFATTLQPGVQQWIESVDFAEIKEAVDGSGKDVLAFVEMVNGVIWQYPSKVIGIFSLLPSLVNVAAGTLNISVEKLNAVPPDLLADIITALLDEVDAEQIGGMITELFEIARKLLVGSALIGEPGAPQLENALANKIEEIISHMDSVIAWKGKIALAKLKASINDAAMEAMAKDPELLKLAMANGHESVNIRLKSENKWLLSLENLDDDTFEKMLNIRLSAVDTQEVADKFNSILRIMNRLWEQNPEICREFARQFLSGLDEYELAFTASSFFESVANDAKPLARAVLPGLIEWGCEVLAPRDDEYEDQAIRARNALKNLLMAEEV